ncbi:ribonuclease III [Mycoplasma sp. Mirounga ES2805-ORL]|uniref:ribonuclease III n=1 Tax=Mycoplasma sp. Mirounga ES2805-ORL TaxID=754514 RepID=UPI00197B9E2C|nr:ribonuclease III [Mycoplasma sp. Mirounga ES2805-ORL]QSF13908.1 ribonuclease III [Mycoplasma sp. Mirounga ES2805-ORL]
MKKNNFIYFNNIKKWKSDLIDYIKTSLNINVNNPQLYETALTHPSYIKHSKQEEDSRVGQYQELEFLGDSILQFLVSDYIFKKHKNLDQGSLTLLRSKLVCTKALANVTNEIQLKKYILTGPGGMYENVIRSQKVAADIFESLVAAIYLDQDINVTRKFVDHHVCSKDELLIQQESLKDYKTTFQEYIQSFSKIAVTYETKSVAEHFESEAKHDNKIYGKGKGKSKSEAEENAAKEALKKLKV